MPYDKTNMVLRYHIGFENTEKRFDQLTDFLKRTGIHRVILFSSCFLEESSFFPEEYYRSHAKLLLPYINKLRDMGVETGINVLNTVGHVFYSNDGEFSFKRAVTVNGEPSRGCACMRDKSFIDYVKKQYKYYADLHPAVIFADDDIRAISLGQIVCLCDEHIRLISERTGKKLTREEIKAHIFSEDFSEDGIKKAFIEQMREDTETLIVAAADAVHEVSPETEFGIMTTSYPSVTIDRDLHGFFGRNYEKNITRIRMGMDFYREGEHKQIPLAFSMPSIQRNLMDDERVEIQPEIENDTYGFFYKSNAVTNMQEVWCLASGFSNMQLNLFDLVSCPADNYDKITDLFADNSEYYNKLADLVGEGNRPYGVWIYADKDSLLHRRASNNDLIFKAEWYNWLGLDGIPVGYDKNTPFIFLTGDDILGADRETVDNILKKGAVIDLRSAEALLYMGYGDRIGITSIEEFDAEYAGERFCDDDINGIYRLEHNSNYINPNLVGSKLKNIKYKEGAKKLSYIIDHKKREIGNGVTLYENALGERFCILPYEPDIFLQFTNVNNKRKHQLINIFGRIAGEKLPVYTENENMAVIFSKKEEHNVITLFNLTSDSVSCPEISYDPLGKLLILCKNGELSDLEYEVCGGTVKIKSPIAPMGTAVIVDKK